MIKNIFAIVVFLNFTTSGIAQYKEYARSVIDTLCSKSMYGRGYVKDGDHKAADFIEQEFKNIGLQAVGREFQQKFEMDINTYESSPVVNLDGKDLRVGVDFILKPQTSSGKGKVKLISFQRFLKIKKVTSKGLVLTLKEYKEIMKTKGLLEKAVQCKIWVIKNSKKLTASLSQEQWSFPIIEVLDQGQFDWARIDFEIESKWKSGYESQNIIGWIPGRKHPDSMLVYCAHYDHLGGMGEVYFPGANDNAAGIAMLNVIAKEYMKNKSDYSVMFIAFGGEEAGLLGSKFFVENPIVDLKKIKFVMNMDLVGTGEKGITVVNGSVFEDDFNRLNEINDKEKFVSIVKKRGGAANSDHYYFTESGVPAFFIYAMGEPSHYHDINDNGSDLKLERFDELWRLFMAFMNSKRN